MSNTKNKEKKYNIKKNYKAPTYKFKSNIKSSIDMKNNLEKRILDAKIEFSLKEVLAILKNFFHELIIDVIKKKRQMTTIIVIARTSDTLMSKEEKEEIRQVFALTYDNIGSDNQSKKI